MGNRAATNDSEYLRLLAEFEVLQRWEPEGVLLLRSLTGGQEHLLREFTFTDRREFEGQLQALQRRQAQLQGSTHLLQLLRVLAHAEDQLCSAYFKLYALFEWLPRSLDDEVNERSLQKRRFQERELWSLAGSCVLALSHLQRQGLPHLSLCSRALLLTEEGLLRLYDPLAPAATPNYEALLASRSSPHLYLSPEETDALEAEQPSPHRNPFKSDIWTMGMVLLEAGLAQYQDECYRDEWTRIHWETLQFNINRFRQLYSADLTALLELMLSREEAVRPDWLDLEERLLRADESLRLSARASHATSERPSEKRITHSQPMRVGFPSSSPTPVSTSLIAQSRPFRSVFPTPAYSTLSQPDENLIFVPDEYSQVSETPNGEYFSSGREGSRRQLRSKQASAKAFSPYVPAAEGEEVVEKYRQGSEYRGRKWRGMRHGYGVFLYLDGGRYEGEWAFNKMEGQGSLYYQSGRLAYEGQWVDDQFAGRGVLHNERPLPLHAPYDYRNLDHLEDYWLRYEGEFKADMKHGKGALFLTNGEIFDGQFANDAAEGAGVFVLKDGKAVFGSWSDNRML